MWRNTVTALMVAGATGGIGWLFWQQELRYQLPTPVPAHYRPVAVGQAVALPAGRLRAAGRPVLLHFFNPGCPCSRFNLRHFTTLVREFGKKADFYAVVPETADRAEAAALLPAGIPLLMDAGGDIARSCGVYASPQAVVLDKAGRLYYRGNYNRARYCTRKNTNYTETALSSLLAGKPRPAFDSTATRAYGCELPVGKPAFSSYNDR